MGAALSKSEFAKLCGVTPGRVSQWLAAGKIGPDALLGEGRSAKIVVETAQAQLRARLDPARSMGSCVHGRLTLATAAGPALDDESTADAVYSAARAWRERYQAESTRLDLEERRGRFVNAVETEAGAMTIFRRARDRMLALPAMTADRLASAPDAQAVRELLELEVRRLVEEIAQDLAAIERPAD